MEGNADDNEMDDMAAWFFNGFDFLFNYVVGAWR